MGSRKPNPRVIQVSTKKVATRPVGGKAKTRAAPSRDALDALGIDALCDMILDGKSYRDIASECKVSMGGLTRWIAKEPERLHACACAREVASQTYDEMAVEGLIEASDMFELSKAKELATHYRWRAKCANPKKYGDKMAIGGASDLPAIQTVYSMTDEQLLVIAASGKK